MPRRKKKPIKEEDLEEEVSEESKKIENPKVCPDCGSEDIGHEAEEFFCRKCGYVLENI